MANKNFAGEQPVIPEPQTIGRIVGRIGPQNCVHTEQSPADFGGNSNAGRGQDGELNAFEKFLRQSQEDVARFNEKLAHEQTKPSPGQ